MKKIALIMDGWKRFFTYAWPAGVLERIRETNEDVNLYIFNSSGDWSRDEDYNIGEYNIYRLPDLNDFDGIIVDLNNIRYPKVRFLNCSIHMPYSTVRTYYSRIYEGKFITGAIAGAIADNNRIGYVGSYPILAFLPQSMPLPSAHSSPIPERRSS